MFANVASPDESVPAVSIDYRKASYEITQLLIEHDAKDIYMLSTRRKYSTNNLKEDGYTKAMEEAKLEPKIFRTSGDTKINRPHFESFFDDKNVDGAIGVRDSIAVSFMNIAIEHGKDVPNDLVIAGFQNTKYAELARPRLTSIDIPVYDIGAVSMRLLTKMMQKKKLKKLESFYHIKLLP